MAITAFSIPALKAELTTDPLGLGYGPSLTAGDDNALADLINITREGGAFQVPRDPVTPGDLFGVVDPNDFGALTATALARLQTVLVVPSIDLSVSNVQEMALGVFANGSVTQANIVALATRQGSRAQALWGKTKIVTTNEVFQARTT